MYNWLHYKHGSVLREKIDRLKFMLEGDFRRKDLDNLEREIINMLDSFMQKMLEGVCDGCRELILSRVGEDISHYGCDLCHRAATQWIGHGKVCDVHAVDIPILHEAYNNLKNGCDKLLKSNL